MIQFGVEKKLYIPIEYDVVLNFVLETLSMETFCWSSLRGREREIGFLQSDEKSQEVQKFRYPVLGFHHFRTTLTFGGKSSHIEVTLNLVHHQLRLILL